MVVISILCLHFNLLILGGDLFLNLSYVVWDMESLKCGHKTSWFLLQCGFFLSFFWCVFNKIGSVPTYKLPSSFFEIRFGTQILLCNCYAWCTFICGKNGLSWLFIWLYVLIEIRGNITISSFFWNQMIGYVASCAY